MPISPYFTLDGRDKLTDPASIVDARLVDYFYSVFSQDPNFKTKSLIYDLALSNEEPDEIKSRMGDSITSLLTPYFEQTDVRVQAEASEDGRIAISLGITVVDDGVTINVGRDLKLRNSKLEEVTAKIYGV